MDQLTLPLKAHKNGNGNGHHRPGHRQFSNDLRKLIDDLQAAEELRADELKRLQLLRASVYAAAAQHGIKPQILRAVLRLQKMRGAESAGGGR